MQVTKIALKERHSLKDKKLYLAEYLRGEDKSLRADDVWKGLPWKRFQRQVFRLQRCIFKALA